MAFLNIPLTILGIPGKLLLKAGIATGASLWLIDEYTKWHGAGIISGAVGIVTLIGLLKRQKANKRQDMLKEEKLRLEIERLQNKKEEK